MEELLKSKIIKSRSKYKNNKKVFIRKDTRDSTTIKESYRCNYTKDDIWLDCGGNIGTFATYYHDFVKCIISFEPEEECCHIFEKNIEINKIDNCILVKKALVSDNDSSKIFYVNLGKDTSSHSLTEKHRKMKVITVECYNINKAISKYNINKIKMDVEGYEYELIKGIENWKNIVEFIFEWHYPSNVKDNNNKLEEVSNILNKNFTYVDPIKNNITSWGKTIRCYK